MASSFLTLLRVLRERRAQERSCGWSRARLESGGNCACGRPYRVIESVDGREEEILRFEANGGGAPVAVLPNLFRASLEGLAVDAWQVIQNDSNLTIRLVGPNARQLCSTAESSLRATIAQIGARVPSIVGRHDLELQRGATGKAPLIVSRKTSP